MQGDQLLPAGAIHADSLPGGKQDPSLGSAVAMNLAYVVDIDNRGPMEPHELARLPVTALRGGESGCALRQNQLAVRQATGELRGGI